MQMRKIYQLNKLNIISRISHLHAIYKNRYSDIKRNILLMYIMSLSLSLSLTLSRSLSFIIFMKILFIYSI